MTRPIKFQVLDRNDFHVVGYDILDNNHFWSIAGQGGIRRQFTGLLDKNGNEIYEGDIVKIPDDYETFGFMAGEIREIIFSHGGFRFKSSKENQRGHWIEDDSEFEIIGNIYENPELLQNAK